MIASAKGQTKVMKLYLKTPSIDLQQQVILNLIVMYMYKLFVNFFYPTPI